ncbi:MAG: glycosyltransferase [Clostridia bacterium]|nr:glycosyltransferase [Clostridia bacterium]
MNILLVTMEMNIGGAETHVLELALSLKAHGNNVYVVSSGGTLTLELEKNGVKHIYAPLKDKKPSHMIESIRTIRKLVEEYQIDVVHAHARIPGFICGIVCRQTHTHFVTTIHGIYRVNFLLKLLTNWGEKTLAVSKDIKEYAIREYHLKPENVFLTINGINTEKFRKKDAVVEDVRFNPSKFKIMHVSRLDKESAEVAEALMDIVDDLNDQIPEGVQLIIVGSGNHYEELIKKSVGKGNIILTGARTDVDLLLNHADMFVGVSRAALEAMASELPVILAGNSSYGQGYQGIFEKDMLELSQNTNFTCRDLEKLSLEKLKQDIIKLRQEKTEEMGKYNRKIVEESYSIEKMTQDALGIYEG